MRYPEITLDNMRYPEMCFLTSNHWSWPVKIPILYISKYDFDGEYHRLNMSERIRKVHSKGHFNYNYVLNNGKGPGIDIDKYNDLQSLCKSQVFPEAHHQFFNLFKIKSNHDLIMLNGHEGQTRNKYPSVWWLTLRVMACQDPGLRSHIGVCWKMLFRNYSLEEC